MKSPDWASTAIFVTWDDFGGFYDHVPPPRSTAWAWGPVCRFSSSRRGPSRATSATNRASSRRSTSSSRRTSAWPRLGPRDSLSQTSDLMDFFNFTQQPGPTLIEPMLKYDKVLSVPNTGSAAVGNAHPSTVNPASGGPQTQFTYEVIYKNTTAPTTHNVVIDGSQTVPISTLLKPSTPRLSEWSSTTTLPAGTHTYTFQFASGSSTYSLPLNSVPFFRPAGRAVRYQQAQDSSPSDGAAQTGQPVTFSVVYTSPAGLTPTTADINISDAQPRDDRCEGKCDHRHHPTATPPRRSRTGEELLRAEVRRRQWAADLSRNTAWRQRRSSL